MNYEEALREWGKRKLASYRVDLSQVDPASISVDFDLDPGYSCCGGSNPDCYCSFAEGASLEATVSYRETKARSRTKSLRCGYLDFGETLRELFEADGR